MGLVIFSEETEIISLNNINQLIFVMETRCVFFAVRTEFLNIIQTSFGFKGLSTISRVNPKIVPINWTNFTNIANDIKTSIYN
jgi:hypothetical protein